MGTNMARVLGMTLLPQFAGLVLMLAFGVVLPARAFAVTSSLRYPTGGRHEPAHSRERSRRRLEPRHHHAGNMSSAASDGGKDVFVHARALRCGGLNGLAEGQRVRMQIGESQKGLEAQTIELLK